MSCYHHHVFILLCLIRFVHTHIHNSNVDDTIAAVLVRLEGKLIKGSKNAIYLLHNGKKSEFPDFNTFTQMGYDLNSIEKISDHILKEIPLGDGVKPIPVFRPDDYFFHEYCDDYDRLINDVGVIPTMGDIFRNSNKISEIKASKSMEIVALGGSITAGGYFEEFVRLLRVNENIDVTVHNHGHGATEITYSIFCVDIDQYSPDLLLIDFSVNDYGHPKLMESLLRKVLVMESQPIVVLVNLWVHQHCPITRYLEHAYYYDIPIISVCPAVNLCYGKKRLPSYISDEYSRTDGVHPWGVKGVPFLGNIMYAWWKRYNTVITDELLVAIHGNSYNNSNSSDKSSHSSSKSTKSSIRNSKHNIPEPLYQMQPIGKCTRCDALVDDADGILSPLDPPDGFRVFTRVKVGYGGFNPEDKNSSTKSFKRSWQADTVGSSISFKFYGSSVRVALWQRRDSMGILNAYVDGDMTNVATATGFFKGFTWAMDRNNTGRSEIIPLFEGLEDKEHVLKLVVSEKPANPWVPGHTVQIFALLSASNIDDVCRKSVVNTKKEKSANEYRSNNRNHR